VEREHGQLKAALGYLAIDVPLPAASEARVRWARSTALPVRGLKGVILANELFDAMPVHRVTVRDGQLRELRVGVGDDDTLADVAAEPTTGIAERLTKLGVDLTEGAVAEVCLEADRWIRDLGVAMESGYLLLIDYGHEASAYYDVSRDRGTLRTYYRHTLGMNPYLNVGWQDISVHVEFTSVRETAREAGFSEVGMTTQAEFLRNLGLDAYRDAVVALDDLRPVVKAANVQAMDSLLDPDGMGGFKVVAFAKGVPVANLRGFVGGSALDGVPAVLTTASHMPLPGVGSDLGEMPTWDELLR
jgi:SAM-dependent MidA family methyltransferase